MTGAGWITAAGVCATRSATRQRWRPAAMAMHFFRPKARRCIRSPSGPCTPALSSLATSALPPTAKPSCASRNGLVMCTRASSISWWAHHSNVRQSWRAAISGDSTVAYAIAFAQAVEAALGLEPPPRAVWLRASHGGTRADRQSSWRHRRDLQRCLILSDACALQHLARARITCGRHGFRSPTDDGSRRARRHCWLTSTRKASPAFAILIRTIQPALSGFDRAL